MIIVLGTDFCSVSVWQVRSVRQLSLDTRPRQANGNPNQRRALQACWTGTLGPASVFSSWDGPFLPLGVFDLLRSNLSRLQPFQASTTQLT